MTHPPETRTLKEIRRDYHRWYVASEEGRLRRRANMREAVGEFLGTLAVVAFLAWVIPWHWVAAKLLP